MFPIDTFDKIFATLQDRWPKWKFADGLSWFSVRELTLAHCLRKYHLKKETETEEQFIKTVVSIQVRARLAASKHLNQLP